MGSYRVEELGSRVSILGGPIIGTIVCWRLSWNPAEYS